MICMMGARNMRGFSSAVQSGKLPAQTHPTYEGVFNQLKFDVGKKTDKLVDLHLGYARYQFEPSRVDSDINDYLALFLKSSKDGADRDDTPLNALICLDVSGSMAGGLGSDAKQEQTRLSLSIQAIKMFISKLRPNDSCGIITFNNKGHVILEPRFKSQISQQFFKVIDELKAGGGTTIRSGFALSKELLSKFIKEHKQNSHCENRIIMLTDVTDNSLSNQQDFINQASTEDGINVTIIGISNEFKSDVCEKLKNVKGFNYFCAVDQDDIKKYVFQTFDFGFFPAASDVQVKLISEDVRSIEVFGTPDSAEVAQYNGSFNGNPNIVVTKMKSVFPSEIEIHKDFLYTIGGLILVKLKRKSKEPFFRGKVQLTYKTFAGKDESQQYPINFQFHPQEQFYSADCLKSAIQGYVFTSELKSMLVKAKTEKRQALYKEYWPMMKELEVIVPEGKKKDFENIKKLLKEYEKKDELEDELEKRLQSLR